MISNEAEQFLLVFFSLTALFVQRPRINLIGERQRITPATLYIRIVIVLENSLRELASALFKLEPSFDGLSVHAFVRRGGIGHSLCCQVLIP